MAKKSIAQESAKATYKESLSLFERERNIRFSFLIVKHEINLTVGLWAVWLKIAQELIEDDYRKEAVLEILEEKVKQNYVFGFEPEQVSNSINFRTNVAQSLVLAKYPVIQEFIDNRGFFDYFDLESDLLVADSFIGHKLVEANEYIGSLGIEDLGSSKDLLKYVLFAGLKEEERAEFAINLETYLNQQEIVIKKRIADKIEHYAKNGLISLSTRGFFELYNQFDNYPDILRQRIPTLAEVMVHIREGELKCVYDPSRERFDLVMTGTYRGGEVPSQLVDPFLQACPEQEKKGRLDVLVDELLFLGQYMIEKRGGNQKQMTS